MTRSARSVPLTIGLGLIALAGLTTPAASAAKGGKPNLVPVSADQRGQPYALRNQVRNGKVKFEIKNIGKSRARGTLTEVRYKGGGESFDGESELTERIAPGKIDPATIRLDELNELPAGSYKLEICADVSEAVNESNERDNCAKVKGSRFYSTYRDWAGSVGGIGWGIGGPAFSGITETWRSADTGIDVVYTFSKYSGAGQFLWIYQGGAVKYTHQGSLGPGCENVYGSATFVLDPGAEVTTDYEKGSYTAKASAITGATYPITSSCGFGGQGPVHGAVLSTGSQSLPFDTQRLAGAAASDVDPGVNYTWDLAGR